MCIAKNMQISKEKQILKFKLWKNWKNSELKEQRSRYTASILLVGATIIFCIVLYKFFTYEKHWANLNLILAPIHVVVCTTFGGLQ